VGVPRNLKARRERADCELVRAGVKSCFAEGEGDEKGGCASKVDATGKRVSAPRRLG
jgi:hypothetical protein